MNPDDAREFYLEKGPVFSDGFDPYTGWSAMPLTVVPESVQFNCGSEPGKVVFHVYADGVEPANVYGPVASGIDPAGKRPDGGIGGLTLPSVNGEVLRPFTLIRLMQYESLESENNIPRFIGVVLTAELDLANEIWVCSALEAPRWRMSKYIVSGEIWHDTNKADPVVFQNCLPHFNPQGNQFYPFGRSNMYLTDAATGYLGDPLDKRVLEFYHPEYRILGVYTATSWRLGDCINYLRKLYWEIVPATGLTILGTPGLHTFMDWDMVTPETHSYLFYQDGGEEMVVPDFILGGMTLVEALDTIVRKAGYGSEWAVGFDNATCMSKIQFYNEKGLEYVGPEVGPHDVTLSRGVMGDPIGDTPADVAQGILSYDWTESATSIKAFAQYDKHEVTIAYDPLNVMGGTFSHMLEPVWDDDAQKMFQYAVRLPNMLKPHAWETDFWGVFTKFRFKENKNWTEAFGPAFDPSKQGVRNVLGGMLTWLPLGQMEIQAKVWRWNETLGELQNQPGGVSLSVLADNSIMITGTYSTPDEDAIGKPDYVQQLPYLCKFVAGDLWEPEHPEYAHVPWDVRPFVLTITVQGDQRGFGSNSGPVPDGWPEELEDSPDIYPFGNHWRHNVIHFLDAGGNPIELNPTTSGIVSAIPEKITDNQGRINSAANRRKRAVERPKCSLIMSLPTFAWDIMPGTRITELTGGGTLQDAYIGALVKRSQFLGIGTKGATKREHIVECGNG